MLIFFLTLLSIVKLFESLKYNPFKINISISSDLNQVFSADENTAYITEDESDYSDSSIDGNTTDEETIKGSNQLIK